MRASTRMAVLATATAVFSFTGGTAGVAELGRFGDRSESGDQRSSIADEGQSEPPQDGSR